MPPFVSIVGRSKTGKTTLIEKLIPVLKSRGYRVGTIKHTPHGFDLDARGKDSDRHRQAGADIVMAAGPEEMIMTKRLEASPAKDLTGLKPYFADMDIVIAEGFKQTDTPKIEIITPAEPPLFLHDKNLLAVVTESTADAHAVPIFTPDDIAGLTDLIEECFITSSSIDN